jgi:hypothetical protein
VLFSAGQDSTGSSCQRNGKTPWKNSQSLEEEPKLYVKFLVYMGASIESF